MSLKPEQQRALAYVHRKGTESRLEDLRAGVEQALARFEAQLRDLDAATARRRPPAGCWSVQEVVDHLVVSNQPAAEQLRCLLRGQRPPGGPVPASLQSPQPMERDWPELRAELHAVHADLRTQLAHADDAFTTSARAPVTMVVKVPNASGQPEPVEWVEDFDWKAFALLLRIHTLEHVAQVDRILAAVGPGSTAEGASP